MILTTATSMIGNNIQNSISGEGEFYSFEEIFYKTTNTIMTTAVMEFGFSESKMLKKINALEKIGGAFGYVVERVTYAVVNGFYNSDVFPTFGSRY